MKLYVVNYLTIYEIKHEEADLAREKKLGNLQKSFRIALDEIILVKKKENY